MARVIWRLEEAVSLVRVLQPLALESGLALSIGGSVLNSGFSWKDLDLVAMPGAYETEVSFVSLIAKLQELGFKSTDINLSHPGIAVHKFESESGKKIDLTTPFLDKSNVPDWNKTPKEEKKYRIDYSV